jgi:hypothetical protein
MNIKILLLLLWIVPGSSLRGIDLHLRDGMLLRDFYEQGIYPRIDGKDGIQFLVDSLTIYLEGIGKVVETGHCRGSFTFNSRNELRYGMFNITEPVSIAEATEILQAVANRFGVQPRYSSFPPSTPPSMEGTPWTAMSAVYKIPGTKRTFTVMGKRSEELVFLHAFFERSTTRKEDWDSVRERRSAPMLQSPEEWSHLSLKGNFPGFANELHRFTYLISSYDQEGNLLPKFQKLKEKIEAKERARIQAMKNGPPPKRTHSKPKESEGLAEKKEGQSLVLWVAVAILLLTCGIYGYQKTRAR